MSAHKYIERICWFCTAAALLLTVLFMNGEAFGIRSVSHSADYETRLFDTGKVHTLDILMDDWEDFIDTCENEEYAVCSAVIDGEIYKNIGIRAKGNTSLSSVSSMNSDRYSFKIEFDQYNSAQSYHGLDKLSLNNLIQDNTFMKDFLVYEMMRKAGAAAPLCSFVYITVNGEDWGLYLAVEGIEESFLQRNYGSEYGELYKPDSLSFGGGRGNGKDFDMEDFDLSALQQEPENNSIRFEIPEDSEIPEGFVPPDAAEGNAPFGGGQMHAAPDMKSDPMGHGGNGSEDVKLQYIDDDPKSYPNIFDSAKTDITKADETRLIAALKALSEQDPVNSVDIDAVLRYFVVHNFVVNGDSYTGSMIHNYYLYEDDGILSMLPWDYNLAFGTFQGNNAESAVNDPIELSGMEDRPMAYWIFADEKYTELYRQYFSEFLSEAVDSGWLDELIASSAQLIEPYVEKDPTKFCTADEFRLGVSAITEFCRLRAQSVSGQLNGTIPSTKEGQSADSSNLVNASSLDLSDMGTMGSPGNAGGFPGFGETQNRPGSGSAPSETEDSAFMPPNNGTMPGGEMPEGMTPPGGTRPDKGENAMQNGAPAQNAAFPKN